MAFEAALQTMLSVAVVDSSTPAESTRSVPIHGAGADLARLFVDTVDDLATQLDIHGRGALDVTIDGILRNIEGGYIAWGYLHGTFEGEPTRELPRLLEPPVVETDASGVVIIRASIDGR